MKQKTLLETLFDNKPGPPPEPVMWRAIYRVDEYSRVETTVGPTQTWFAARELARIEFTRELGCYIEADTIHVHLSTGCHNCNKPKRLCTCNKRPSWFSTHWTRDGKPTKSGPKKHRSKRYDTQ